MIVRSGKSPETHRSLAGVAGECSALHPSKRERGSARDAIRRAPAVCRKLLVRKSTALACHTGKLFLGTPRRRLHRLRSHSLLAGVPPHESHAARFRPL